MRRGSRLVVYLIQLRLCHIALRKNISILAQFLFSQYFVCKCHSERSEESQNKKRDLQKANPFLFGVPDWSRTSGLQSRSLTLYPTELQAQIYCN